VVDFTWREPKETVYIGTVVGMLTQENVNRSATPFRERSSYKWWVLVTVSASAIMAALDLSLLTTCLPHLANVFHTDSSVIGWLNIVYFIMTQSLMMTLSKVGDTRGRKMMFMAGLACYIVGLLVASFSQGVTQLIVARVIQGAAGATVTALGTAITVAVFPGQERGKALGILIGSASIGLVAGPVIGGVLLDLLGWRAVFWTRAPFFAVCLVMAWIVIGEQKKDDAKFRFDTLGAVSLFVWLSSLLLFLSFGSKWGYLAFPSILLMAVVVVFFAAFILAEKKSAEPIVDLAIFKNRLFSAAIVSSMGSTIGSSSSVFLVPFFLVQGLGFSGTAAGSFMALLAVPSLVLSPLSGRLSDRMGSRLLSTTGVGIVCVGLIWFMMLGPGSSLVSIGIGIVLVGSGLGIFHPPNNSAMVGSVPKDMLGVASAVGQTARHVGSSVSLAVAGSIYSTHVARHVVAFTNAGHDLFTAKRMASVAGFSDTLAVTLCFAIVGVMASLFRGSGKTARSRVERAAN
jgi:EmrB/QacA subfamily drug resistance transporter